MERPLLLGGIMHPLVRALVAAISTVAVVGCGPTWPSKVTTAAVPNGHHGTVDVLPLDLELWTEAGYDDNIDQLRGTAEAAITNATVDALTRHAYSVDALIDWNGDYPGGHALQRDAMLAAIATLSRYGDVVGPVSRLPALHLPAELGTGTGADATLYIGGWGFVANHHESTADKVAKGVAIALVVVAIAVLVAGAAQAMHDGKARHEDEVVHHSRSRGSSFAQVSADAVAEVASDVANTVIAIGTHPEWGDDPSLPHEGDSELYLEMTLVDNHTGRALWHAHQRFPAHAASAGDVERAARSLLATLPAT